MWIDGPIVSTDMDCGFPIPGSWEAHRTRYGLNLRERTKSMCAAAQTAMGVTDFTAKAAPLWTQMLWLTWEPMEALPLGGAQY